MSKVLVTGGAGFVGKAIVERLHKDGHQVVVLDALIENVHHEVKPSFPRGVKFYHGNVLDDKVLRKALVGIEYVFHQAAEVGVGLSMYEMERFVRNNELATAKLMEVITQTKNSVKKVIVASSMASYGEGAYRCIEPECDSKQMVFPNPRESVSRKQYNYHCLSCGKTMLPAGISEEMPRRPASIYGLGKRNQEEIVLMAAKAYGLPAVSLRYFNIVGAGQSINNPYTGVVAMFTNQLIQGTQPIIFEDGEQIRDFVSVHDVVEANVLAMKYKGKGQEMFNIGSGRMGRIKEVAMELANLVGKKNLSPKITGQFRKGDCRHVVADISKAKKMLGYSPKVSLNEMLEEYAQWAMKQKVHAKIDETTKILESKGLVK